MGKDKSKEHVGYKYLYSAEGMERLVVTICSIRVGTDEFLGMAICSPGDIPDSKEGVKRSRIRARMAQNGEYYMGNQVRRSEAMDALAELGDYDKGFLLGLMGGSRGTFKSVRKVGCVVEKPEPKMVITPVPDGEGINAWRENPRRAGKVHESHTTYIRSLLAETKNNNQHIKGLNTRVSELETLQATESSIFAKRYTKLVDEVVKLRSKISELEDSTQCQNARNGRDDDRIRYLERHMP